MGQEPGLGRTHSLQNWGAVGSEARAQPEGAETAPKEGGEGSLRMMQKGRRGEGE